MSDARHRGVRYIDEQQQPTPESLLSELRRKREEEPFTGIKHEPLNGRPARYLWLADTHRPRHCTKTWAIFLQAIRDLKPDGLVIVGDYMDMMFANSHEKMPGDEYTPTQEFFDANRGLDEISEALGKKPVEYLYIDGNHEHRWKRMRARGIPPEWRDVFDEVPVELRCEQRGIHYVPPEKQPYRLFSNWWVHHGHWWNQHHAYTHAIRLAGNNVYGHTHRPQIHTTVNLHGPVVSIGLPCSRDVRAEWRHPPTQPFNTWVRGFAVSEVDGDNLHFSLVLTEGGRAAYAGYRWSVAPRGATRRGVSGDASRASSSSAATSRGTGKRRRSRPRRGSP